MLARASSIRLIIRAIADSPSSPVDLNSPPRLATARPRLAVPSPFINASTAGPIAPVTLSAIWEGPSSSASRTAPTGFAAFPAIEAAVPSGLKFSTASAASRIASAMNRSASLIVAIITREMVAIVSMALEATSASASGPPTFSIASVICPDSIPTFFAASAKAVPITSPRALRFLATRSTPPASLMPAEKPRITASPMPRKAFLRFWIWICARFAGSASCLSTASPVAPVAFATASSTSCRSPACLPVRARAAVNPRRSGNIARSFFWSSPTASARSRSTAANPSASMRVLLMSTPSSWITSCASFCGESSADIAPRRAVTASSVARPPFVNVAVAAESSSRETPSAAAIGIARPRELASSGSVVLPWRTVSKRMSEYSPASDASAP